MIRLPSIDSKTSLSVKRNGSSRNSLIALAFLLALCYEKIETMISFEPSVCSMILLLTSFVLGMVCFIWALIENAKWKRIVIRSAYVLPTNAEALKFSTELQGVDTGFFLVPDVPVVWVWKNQKLDFERLRVGLERALNRVPIAAGRMIIGKENLEINLQGSKGCYLLLKVRESESLPDISAPASTWSKYGIFDPLIPKEPFDKPLLSATLTHFKNGSCLYVNFSHMLMDGAAMSMFMQIWSHETNLAADIPMEVKEPPADVDCDHKFRDSNVQLSDSDKARYMSFFGAVQFILCIAWNYYTQQLVDFEFTADTWSKLKDKVQTGLKEGEWVSSYEAMMGTVLSCIGQARAKNGNTTVDARAIVNIRGRSKLFSPRYFGCALGMHEFQVPTNESSSGIASKLHDTLRAALKDVSTLEKTVLIPQVAGTQRPTRLIGRLFGGRLDYVQRARYVLGWEKSSVSDSYIVNSWVGYPWLEVQFATGQDADFMRVPPAFRSPRQAFVGHVTKDMYQLRVSLPRGEVKMFTEALKATGMDFRMTENRNTFWYFPLVDPDWISACLFSARSNALHLYCKVILPMMTKAGGPGDRLPSVGKRASMY